MRPDLAAIKEAPSSVEMTCLSCWNENPEERPGMKKVRQMLDPIATGM